MFILKGLGGTSASDTKSVRRMAEDASAVAVFGADIQQ